MVKVSSQRVLLTCTRKDARITHKTACGTDIMCSHQTERRNVCHNESYVNWLEQCIEDVQKILTLAAFFSSFYLLLSRVMRNIRWIMWLTLSCSHSSCRDRKERLISATESSFSSTLSDTEFSDSDWLSPESSTVKKGIKMMSTITKDASLAPNDIIYTLVWV